MNHVYGGVSFIDDLNRQQGIKKRPIIKKL
jgi:hypothetical protein